MKINSFSYALGVANVQLAYYYILFVSFFIIEKSLYFILPNLQRAACFQIIRLCTG